MRVNKIEKLLLFVLFAYSFPLYSDELLDADEAYYLHDYSTALTLYEKLASEGDAIAQINLALMYDGGQGVAQNYKKAFHWYKNAAEQRVVEAQVNLGYMYRYGQGVSRDYIMAYKWFNIALENGNGISLTLKDYVSRSMTQSQIEIAQKLSSEWLENHQ